MSTSAVTHWRGEGEPWAEMWRGGVAVECIAVASDGWREAVGFLLDKTLCMFNVAAVSGGGDTVDNGEDELGASDWVRFNTAAKMAKFSRRGTWLAVLGGSSIIVVRDVVDS